MATNRLVIRPGCNQDPGLQIPVSQSGISLLEKVAAGVAPCGPACWPVGAVFVAAGGTDPNSALGFGSWEMVQHSGHFDYWKRTA